MSILASHSIGFIGAGNMAEALIGGLVRGKHVAADKIAASDPRKERLEELRAQFGIDVTTVNKEIVLRSGVIVLSVKPQIMDKILRQWAGPYDQSPDGNPILGAASAAHPDFFLACGFVGHGFMMAPIVGKLYAEMLTGGTKHEIFERYTLGRFTDGSGASYPKEDFNIG